jgi:streptomycin 6-kinase
MWADAGLVGDGLRLFEELSHDASETVLVAADLHAGNVLRAKREPWLVIDPKPFVGDPAYDVTQHLFNCERRLFSDPSGTIRRIADLVEVEITSAFAYGCSPVRQESHAKDGRAAS